MCGCSIRDNIRRDCHWYHCEHQMGASIDCCTLRENLGDCPCSDDCKDYIGYSEVNRIIVEHMKHSEQIGAMVPSYPLKLEPPEGLPKALAEILDGIYKTSDAGEAATLASTKGWIICDVVWAVHPETWVLGSLKNPE